MKKILGFMILILVAQIGTVGLYDHSAFARVKSYTTQNINVNKAPPAVTQKIKVEKSTLPAPLEAVEQILEVINEESEEAARPTLYMPKEQSDPDTLLLEKLAVIEPVEVDIFALDNGYILGAEDKIKVTVFGERDLSGDYKIGGDGAISMPLIGVVHILDMSLRQAEKAIEAKLLDGYLKVPSVSIEVQESRPFYIMGEIRRPGSYNYINGMSVIQAIAISGGFTYRANRKSVDVVRGKASSSKPVAISPNDLVQAGDIIFVRERFF